MDVILPTFVFFAAAAACAHAIRHASHYLAYVVPLAPMVAAWAWFFTLQDPNIVAATTTFLALHVAAFVLMVLGTMRAMGVFSAAPEDDAEDDGGGSDRADDVGGPVPPVPGGGLRLPHRPVRPVPQPARPRRHARPRPAHVGGGTRSPARRRVPS
jgi:hypothetical protein